MGPSGQVPVPGTNLVPGAPQLSPEQFAEVMQALAQQQATGPAAGMLPTQGAAAGISSRVSSDDFLRYIQGFGGAGATDYASLAGMTPDLSQFGGRGGGRGGGGGGGGQPGNQTLGSANSLLQALFSGGGAQMDPAIMGQIQGLLGNQNAQYGQMPGLIGGGEDPIMALIRQELGGGSSMSQFSGGGGGFGGSSAAGAFSRPDIALKGISPEAQALIDQMTASSKAGLNLSRGEASGQALSDLFGRGMARSSIAQDKFGRLQYGHEQALQGADAAGAQQTLGAMLADQAARVEMGKATIGAEAQLGSANASAAGSAGAAAAAAQSDMARARMGLLGDVFGSRSSALANAFGSQSGANQGFAGIFGDAGRAQLAADSERANTAQSFVDSSNRLRASLADSRMQLQGTLGSARIGQQTALANLPFENQLATETLRQGQLSREQDAILKLLGIDTDRYLGETSAAATRYAADRNKPKEPSFMDKLLPILGTLGGAAIMASDRRLKTAIKDVDEPWTDDELRQIKPKSWDWLSGGSGRGVIAQDLKKVSPELVVEKDGIMGIFGTTLVKSLSTAHRLLEEKEARA